MPDPATAAAALWLHPTPAQPDVVFFRRREACRDGGLVRGNRIQVAHFTEPVAPRGSSSPQILVGLRMRAKAAEMACHENQIATVDIQLPAGGCEDSRR